MVWTGLHLPPIAIEARSPLTVETILKLFLPAQLAIVASAYATTHKYGFLTRVSLLPVVLFLCYRLAVGIDVSRQDIHIDVLGFHIKGDNLAQAYFNQGLLIGMFLSSLRAISWTFSGAPSRSVVRELCTLRGKHVPKPCEWRPTGQRGLFIFLTILSALASTLLFDLIHIHIHILAPDLFRVPGGHPNGLLGNEWPTLKTMHLSACAYLLTWLTLHRVYDVATLVGVGLVRQDPAEWPPLFGTFYVSTSLRAFWGRQWHQLFRDAFVGAVGKPVSLGLTRIGAGASRSVVDFVAGLAVFVVSAVMHWLGIWAMGMGSDGWKTGGFFVVQYAGIVLQTSARRLAGEKRNGLVWALLSWAFTAFWIVWWGTWMVDEWVRRGFVFDLAILPDPAAARLARFLKNVLPYGN
ncbi:hypothetical protein CYLTODRAFT_441881 [Cylindrobasidium torrendii FP15055 ss-10]|uniref:Wax synthase domain-containing protein n=1 Tax=Cylindrobasidium torrendii FP15055 ss-10 TaxID=1314674 RepID=A0A0D7BK98_9AGAR|nr:hypothetical protein CYLTODRAFT_441881 [Cylindrobasidium torrendii FP15055 ss-10]